MLMRLIRHPKEIEKLMFRALGFRQRVSWLAHKTAAFLMIISLPWPIYLINKVDKIKDVLMWRLLVAEEEVKMTDISTMKISMIVTMKRPRHHYDYNSYLL